MEIIKELAKLPDGSYKKYRQVLAKQVKEDGNFYSKDEIIATYRDFIKTGELDEIEGFIEKFRLKPTRTMSGIASVTVLTKPFPCPGKCIFCPEAEGMPKSYLPSEPGAQRAASNDFHPYLQVYNRLLALHDTGHTVDKIELIVLGGTWSFYETQYKIWFIKECFKAMNDFDENDQRDELDWSEEATWEELEELQVINETAKSRSVGLVIETRPDFIT